MKSKKYHLFPLPEDLEHNADNIFRYILLKAHDNLKNLKKVPSNLDCVTKAFLSLKSWEKREEGKKFEEFFIASIVMKYSEALNPNDKHYLAYPEGEPTDVIMIRKASNKFFRHDLQIKHVFDYKTLSSRTTHYIAKDFETSFLTLDEVTKFILPHIKKVIGSKTYNKTILVFFIRATGSFIKVSELRKKFASQLSQEKIQGIYIIMPFIGVYKDDVKELITQKDNNLISRFLILEVTSIDKEGRDDFVTIDFKV